MEIAYQNILDKLTTEVPELRFIDLDGGQLEAPEDHYQPDLPAAFIRFSMPRIQTVGPKFQQIHAEVYVRVAFQVYEDMNNLTPESLRTSALDKLKITKKVHKALQGYIGDNFNAMDRFNQEQEDRQDGLIVFRIGYRTYMKDDSAMDDTTTKEGVSVTINPEVKP